MPRTIGTKGSWILLGLGSLAAACGALAFHRFRARPQGNPAVSPVSLPLPVTGAPEPEAGAASLTGSEPWLEPLRLAMESSPHASGYGKSAWTAPLLARYLQDTQGLETPLPAVRRALKDLGYRWEHTRYVRARADALPDGSASAGTEREL